MFKLILLSLVIGVSASIVLNSDPFEWLLKKCKLDHYKLFKCHLCFGFWYTFFWLTVLGTDLWYSFIFAGLGAYTSEKINRSLLS